MRGLLCGVLAMILAGCAARPPAPVEDRSRKPDATRPLPSGYYRVSRGDTLYAIAFTHGLDYRVLARWNGLQSPYLIYPGQALRLTAPPGDRPAPKQESKTRPSAPVASQPKPATTQAAGSAPASGPAPAQAAGDAASGGTKPAAQAPAPESAARSPAQPAPGDPTAWRWPVEGRIVRGFLASDPSRNGVDIAASEGEVVKASASGTVVYSGNGLIGYGELIIIKHSDRMLSAYGHNRKRLVAEGESVRAGQEIAELGRNDHNEAVLHFEIRINGKPVNPLDHLPRR